MPNLEGLITEARDAIDDWVDQIELLAEADAEGVVGDWDEAVGHVLETTRYLFEEVSLVAILAAVWDGPTEALGH